MPEDSNPLDDLLLDDLEDEIIDPGGDGDSGHPEGEGEIPKESPGAEGEKPHGQDPENRTGELERRAREMEERLVETLAENAALKTRMKTDETEDKKKRFSLDELKQFASKEDGKFGFDAGVYYTNQKYEDLLKEVEQRLGQRDEQAVVAEVVNEVLPDLDNPKSDNYRAVQNEAAKLQRRGIQDPQKAWEAAMFKVASARKPSKSTDGEKPENFSNRRKVEEARGEGRAPASHKSDENVPKEMTKEQLITARKMGIRGVFHKDPKIRARERAIFLARQRRFEERRLV